MSKIPTHILVIRLSAMGDVAMTVPVLRALVDQHPEIKVTVVTRKIYNPFFQDLPNVNTHNAEVEGRHKGIIGMYRLAKEIKPLGIDAIADLHNVIRSKLLRAFSPKIQSTHIDKGRSEKKALTSGRTFKQLKTTHQRYTDVFKELGFEIDLSDPTFPESRKLSEQSLALTGKKDTKWIGIAPFAQHESKMYPMEQMRTVIKQLCEDHRLFLFGGGEKESNQLEELQGIDENVVNLSGKLSLDEELDIISNLDLMLSMDSGNAHIAAMLGKKVVTLWGVTHPYAGFYPFGQDKDWALLADRKSFPNIPTSVYGNKYPNDYKEAIGSISPETIIKKIEAII